MLARQVDSPQMNASDCSEPAVSQLPPACAQVLPPLMHKAGSCLPDGVPWPSSKPPLMRRSKSLDRLDSGSGSLPSSQPHTAAPEADGHGVPVFVMLPLDTVCAPLASLCPAGAGSAALTWDAVQVTQDGVFRYAASAWFHQALATLSNSGVHGVAVDVWVRQCDQ